MSNLLSFNFLGFDSYEDLDLNVTSVNRPIFQDIKSEYNYFPKANMDVLTSKNIKGKTITVECTLLAKNKKDQLNTLNSLADLFAQTLDTDLYPITFSDEPKATYWVTLNNPSDVEKIFANKSYINFTLEFYSPDGLKYFEDIDIDLKDGYNYIDYKEKYNAPTKPLFNLNTEANLKSVEIADNDGNVLKLGADLDFDDNSTSGVDLVLNDTCNDLSLYTQRDAKPSGTNAYHNSINVNTNTTLATTSDAITMTKNDKNRFDSGSNSTTKINGAYYNRFLTNELDDWSFSVGIYNHDSYARSVWATVVYLLDINGEVVGFVDLRNFTRSLENRLMVAFRNTEGKYYVGYDSNNETKKINKKGYTGTQTFSYKYKDKVTQTYYVKKKKSTVKKSKTKTVTKTKIIKAIEDETENGFTNFYGEVTLHKKGTKFWVEVVKKNKRGVQIWRKKSNMFRSSKIGKLGGYGIFIGDAKISPEDTNDNISNVSVDKPYRQPRQQVTNIKIKKYNPKASTDKNYILTKGDVLTVDMDNKSVYVNGKLRMDLINPSSTGFFGIQNGESAITVHPSPSANNFTWTMNVTPKQY